MSKPLHILFLCTHNSARSILAEAMLNHMGGGRFIAHSAGSSPRENQMPNPFAITVLKEAGVAIDALTSKSWDAFGVPDAPKMDAIITVCASAAGEVCPIWPGHPSSAHWGYDDPSNVVGDETARKAAFEETRRAISRRLQALIAEPADALAPERLKETLTRLSAIK
ncbi:MAG: arsenate reductase ArsC [Candidatus Puniceispirillaceae bacterium]